MRNCGFYYLPGGGQNQDDRAVSTLQVGLVVAVDDARKGVAESLAGPGLGDADKVVTLERDGEALGLDGGRRGEPGVPDLLHDVVRKVSVFPSHDRVWSILLTLDDDDFVLMPIKGLISKNWMLFKIRYQSQ